MLRLDKINVEVGKVIQQRIALGDMQQPPQQYPVARMTINPGVNLEFTLKRLAKDIISLVSRDVPNLTEGELVDKIRTIVDNSLPEGFAQNPIIRELDLPGETFAGGDQQGSMVIVSISTSYKGVNLGLPQ